MSSAQPNPNVLPYDVTMTCDLNVVKRWWRLYNTPGRLGDAYTQFKEGGPLDQLGMLQQLQGDVRDVANYIQWLEPTQITLIRRQWSGLLRLPELPLAVDCARPRNEVQQQQPPPPSAHQQPHVRSSQLIAPPDNLNTQPGYGYGHQSSGQTPLTMPRAGAQSSGFGQQSPHPAMSTVPSTLQPRAARAGQGSSSYHSATLPPDPHLSSQPLSHVQQPHQMHAQQFPPQQPHIQSSQVIAPPGYTQPGYGYGHQSSGERPSQTPLTTPRAGAQSGLGQHSPHFQGQGQGFGVPGTASAQPGQNVSAPASSVPFRPNFLIPREIHDARLEVAKAVYKEQKDTVIPGLQQELLRCTTEMNQATEERDRLADALSTAERARDAAITDARARLTGERQQDRAAWLRGNASDKLGELAGRQRQAGHTFPDYRLATEAARQRTTAYALDQQTRQQPLPDVESDPEVIRATGDRDSAQALFDAQEQIVDRLARYLRRKGSDIKEATTLRNLAQQCMNYKDQTLFMQKESTGEWSGPVQNALDEWYRDNKSYLLSVSQRR